MTSHQDQETGAVIIGSGDHGRGLLETLIRAHPERPILGFIDDNPKMHGRMIGGYPVLGSIDWLRIHPEKVRWLYLGLGHPRDRRETARKLADLRFAYPPLVHPSVVLHGDVQLGDGAYIGAGVVIAHAATIGARALVNLNATIGHDVILGDDVSVGPGANLAGWVHVEEGSFIGMNATLPPRTKVGAWSEVAAASLVLRPVRSGYRVLGNPARELGPVDFGRESPDQRKTG
ncbi:MAG: acetyltransferase [Candidatus Eisenbacteria bacterium]|uniref:Acetyltransferase n=1 Tax=Eiseniibacteriota bacterium TaxID=2212470 RepID=A0A948S0N5_UNCEI|nr:acetyltransferase [Candidatus Eisenbacteria bacterium]MBU2691669.1 acetyltransferase [Candidatus Eisenbacteria bacterium]